MVRKRVEGELPLLLVVFVVFLSYPSPFPTSENSEGLYTRQCSAFSTTLRLVLHVQTSHLDLPKFVYLF